MDGLKLFFSYFKFFFGTSILACALALPVFGAVLFFSFWKAGLFLALVSCLAFCFFLLFSEWGILRALHGQVPRTHGLRNSYEMAYAASGIRLKTRPSLVTFPDPVPNMFVIRAAGGDGIILLSEGFISILDESELRFVLTKAIQHLVTEEVVLQTACIFALLMIQGQATATRSQGLRGVLPGSALKNLMLYPWMRFFSSLARAVTRRVGVNVPEDFVRGASKLARAEKLYGQQALFPGLVYLGLGR
jgi:Zn-dependent protease with chaperone function